MEEVFTIKEAAALLKLHPESLRQLWRQGKIKATKIGVGRGRLRFAKQDLEDFWNLRREDGNPLFPEEQKEVAHE